MHLSLFASILLTLSSHLPILAAVADFGNLNAQHAFYIQSALNGFVLEWPKNAVSAKMKPMRPPSSTNKAQLWKYSHGYLQNLDSLLYLSCRHSVLSMEEPSSMDEFQLWQMINGEIYCFEFQSSVLDIEGANWNEDANVILWDRNHQKNQKWIAVSAGAFEEENGHDELSDESNIENEDLDEAISELNGKLQQVRTETSSVKGAVDPEILREDGEDIDSVVIDADANIRIASSNAGLVIYLSNFVVFVWLAAMIMALFMLLLFILIDMKRRRLHRNEYTEIAATETLLPKL